MSNITNVNKVLNWIPGDKHSYCHEGDATRRFQQMNRLGRFPYYYKYAFHTVEGPEGDFIVADLKDAIKIQTDFDSNSL